MDFRDSPTTRSGPKSDPEGWGPRCENVEEIVGRSWFEDWVVLSGGERLTVRGDTSDIPKRPRTLVFLGYDVGEVGGVPGPRSVRKNHRS